MGFIITYALKRGQLHMNSVNQILGFLTRSTFAKRNNKINAKTRNHEIH